MNLSTKYLGLCLPSPLIVSASRLSEKITNIKAMEAAGAGAVVIYSIFEEEITLNKDFNKYMIQLSTNNFDKTNTYYSFENQKKFLDDHLKHLTKAVKSVTIPIIGSINAVTTGNWMDYAIEMQNTGISALELNLYYLPMDQSTQQQVEKQYFDVIKSLKQKLRIPLVIKLNPFFTSLKDFVSILDKTLHVDGVILFNRFYYPDIDINEYKFKSNIELSTSYEARLSMRWIALLHHHVSCSIGGGTGVNTQEDLIKYLLVGANVVTCASCLLKHGISYITALLEGLEKWMAEKHFTSIEQMRGLLDLDSTMNKSLFERVQYLRALRGFRY